MKRLFLASAVASCAALTACGGGGGGGQTPAPGTGGNSSVPDSALSSIGGLTDYIKQLIGMTSDTSEPVAVGDAKLPTSETSEPSN